MSEVHKFFGLTLALGVTFFLSLVQDVQAQALIFVNGTAYEVTANSGTYNGVNSGGALTNTATAPWFTGVIADNALATTFRDTFINDAPATAIPDGTILLFAHIVQDNINLSPCLGRGGASLFALDCGIDPNFDSGGSLLFATAVEVPEINGSALAQMLLVLLVLFVGYLMVMARRRTLV